MMAIHFVLTVIYLEFKSRVEDMIYHLRGKVSVIIRFRVRYTGCTVLFLLSRKPFLTHQENSERLGPDKVWWNHVICIEVTIILSQQF